MALAPPCGGIYTFVRLLLLLAPPAVGERPATWAQVTLGVAMVAIALLSLDVFASGLQGTLDAATTGTYTYPGSR